MGFNDINIQVSGPQQPASIYKTKVLKGQVPFATQVTEPNTKYVIKHNFELDGDVTIPANCVLQFDGGSISGEYTLTGNNTCIEAGLVQIFNTDVTLAGTWDVAEVYPEWFGAKGDGNTDCANAFDAISSLTLLMNHANKTTCVVKLKTSSIYCISRTFEIYNGSLDLNGSCIKAVAAMDYLIVARNAVSAMANWNYNILVKNGTIDGNGLAEAVITYRNCTLNLSDLTIKNAKTYGLKTYPGGNGFVRGMNLKFVMDEQFVSTDGVPSDNITYAMYFTSGDSQIYNVEIVDFIYAIYEPVTTANLYNGIHHWGYKCKLANTVFAYIYSGTNFVNVTIDTIQTGFIVKGNVSVTNCVLMDNKTVWESQRAKTDTFYLFKKREEGDVDAKAIGVRVNIEKYFCMSDNTDGSKIVLDLSRIAYAAGREFGTNINYNNAKILDNVCSFNSGVTKSDATSFKDYTEAGVYYISDTSTLSDKPTQIGNGCILEVVQSTRKPDGSDRPYLIQRLSYMFQEYGFNHWVRYRYGNSDWTPWMMTKYGINRNYGNTASRPSPSGNSDRGISYFDVTLGKPIWWNGTAWVDATGTPV